MTEPTYSIDTYGPDRGGGPVGAVGAPPRLTHREAHEHLTRRLRELAGTDTPPPHRDGSWSAVAGAALRASADRPGAPLRVAVTERSGCLLTMHRAAVNTSRPAVAVIMPEDGSDLPRVCLGWWQPDGSWADAEVGPGGVGLADAIREEVGRTVCSVVCQSFTGELTPPYRYDAGSPAEDGSLRLPRIRGGGEDHDRAARRHRGRGGEAYADAPPRPARPGVGGKEPSDTSRELVEEVLRTAISLQEVFSTLSEELPEGAFPGEENACVLLEMIVGTVGPAIAAAGEEGCRLTIALVAAMRERVLADLRAALGLPGEDRS